MLAFRIFRRYRPALAAVLLILVAAPALADDSLWNIEIEGYGEMLFSWKDYGPNQNREGGSQNDSRLVFDQTRFVLEVEGRVPGPRLSFEAEVEVEHGGEAENAKNRFRDLSAAEREALLAFLRSL